MAPTSIVLLALLKLATASPHSAPGAPAPLTNNSEPRKLCYQALSRLKNPYEAARTCSRQIARLPGITYVQLSANRVFFRFKGQPKARLVLVWNGEKGVIF